MSTIARNHNFFSPQTIFRLIPKSSADDSLYKNNHVGPVGTLFSLIVCFQMIHQRQPED